VKSIHGTLSVRSTRSKKNNTIKLPDGSWCRIRITPWMRVENNYIWIISLAVSKSNRQINDWMKKRKNKRARSLSKQMTGKFAGKVQAFAVRQMRAWMKEHFKNDSIVFKCESVEAEKQYRIWKKWFARWESEKWEPVPEYLGFYYFKN